MDVRLFRGHIFDLPDGTELEDAAERLIEHRDGAILVDAAGRIADGGPFEAVRSRHPSAVAVPTPRSYILPGFVDTHVHFPQVHARARFGGGELLPWLERCVFPAEARLADPTAARRAADAFTRALARNGTTCSLVYGSQFPVAQNALVEALSRRGLRAIVGRTLMTEGATELTLPLDVGLALAAEEVERWHPAPDRARDALLGVAVVPRFALSFDEDGLRRIGEFYAEIRGRGVWLTTHLSENATPEVGEVARVRQRFGVPNYLDVYDGRARRGGPSWLGRRTVLAHAVHVSDSELSRLAASETGVAHCPNSQLFLGSGTMPLRRHRRAGVRLGVGSDVGAGDSYLVPQVLNAAYKVHLSSEPPARQALHPAQLLHLGTLGGAQVLDLEDRIGTLAPGKDADFVVISPSLDPVLDDLLRAPEIAEGSAADRLFALLMTLSPAAVSHAYVRGRSVNTEAHVLG